MMDGTTRKLAVFVALVLAVTGAPVAATPAMTTSPATRCESLARQEVSGFSIVSAVVNTSGNHVAPFLGGGTKTATGLPGFCDITAQRQDPSGHINTITTSLPLDTWNGRFRCVGGSGYFCGPTYVAPGRLAADRVGSLRAGYSTASTDCGHTGSPIDGSFAHRADGTLGQALVNDFASTGIHQMTVVGKELGQS